MGWTIYEGVRKNRDALGDDVEQELQSHRMAIGQAFFWLVAGLLLLMVSSRALVWGAVEIAHALQVSDLVIGLTVVAVGTSLPELASTIAASRRGETDIALGNVIGSNLFNTLAVVGLAGVINPMQVPAIVFYRDVMVMAGLTLYLFVSAYDFGVREPRINRVEGGVLLVCYIAYTVYLINTAFVA
jgi:cation:H+ antiporter